ncbi:MAG: ParA family protein [Boseongicola sp. SB0664_bin_43]|uniref:Chromosome partitioning protein ParA n=1 Tax=Boseongicola sp. SB0664_bin_43 TaxID=2604844 RepID=A0A6B0Y128_9RHOB|nr:ParA family protein [Boseongicola sp. SB0664_bin_43]MYK32229.1 ParA family protein [Boseongicola sp. SB0670_bin_30]
MPKRSPRPRIIAIANQKGGVGKTTTAINLGAALAESGYKTLLVDLDPQGNASTGLGIGHEHREYTTYDLVLESVALQRVVQDCGVEGLYVAPGTTDLSSADVEMVSMERRSYLLRNALRHPDTDSLGLDFMLIDCPPALNLLTVNAMVAADSVLVPLQTEFLALEGLSQLMLTLRKVRDTANPDLRIEGIILTMYDGRNKLSQQVAGNARETLGGLVYDTIVPRNVRISEAPGYAMPVIGYEPDSKGATAYRALAEEMLAKQTQITS